MIVNPSPAKPMAGSVVRWAIVLVAGMGLGLVIAYHKHIAAYFAAVAPALAALAWSLAQKVWAAREKWAAYLATPPKSPPNHPQAVKAVASPKGLFMSIDDLVADAKGVLAKAESLFAAQPQALQTDEGALLKEAMTALTPKLETAASELATAASPTFGPVVVAFLNNAIAEEEPAIEADLAADVAAANQKADARRSAVATVKAAVA